MNEHGVYGLDSSVHLPQTKEGDTNELFYYQNLCTLLAKGADPHAIRMFDVKLKIAIMCDVVLFLLKTTDQLFSFVFRNISP